MPLFFVSKKSSTSVGSVTSVLTQWLSHTFIGGGFVWVRKRARSRYRFVCGRYFDFTTYMLIPRLFPPIQLGHVFVQYLGRAMFDSGEVFYSHMTLNLGVSDDTQHGALCKKDEFTRITIGSTAFYQ